jgi:hypothetical protein
MALHQEGADAPPSEHHGGGEAGEATTYDQDGNANVRHDWALRSEYTDIYIRSRIFRQEKSERGAVKAL